MLPDMPTTMKIDNAIHINEEGAIVANVDDDLDKTLKRYYKSIEAIFCVLWSTWYFVKVPET